MGTRPSWTEEEDEALRRAGVLPLKLYDKVVTGNGE